MSALENSIIGSEKVSVTVILSPDLRCLSSIVKTAVGLLVSTKKFAVSLSAAPIFPARSVYLSFSSSSVFVSSSISLVGVKVDLQVSLSSMVASVESEPTAVEAPLLRTPFGTEISVFVNARISHEVSSGEIGSENSRVTIGLSPILTSTSSIVNELTAGGIVSTLKLSLSGTLACEILSARLSALSVITAPFKEKAF